MTTLTSILDHIQKWLSTTGLKGPFTVTPLAGDGSVRGFFRVGAQGEGRTWVLLSDPEWKMSQDYPSHQAHLKHVGIPVPGFPFIDPKQGLLLMDDLGDELLQFYLIKDLSQKRLWLEKAIRLLADLHGRVFPVLPTLPVSTRSFDTQKYFDEFLFTFEHLYSKLLKQPSPNHQGLVELRQFCGTLEKISPTVFCHRDYHCRNLLVHQNSLWMIDFQDARLGPPHYDVASLLFDAYLPISEPEKAQLLAAYKDQLSQYPLSREIDWTGFEKSLGLVAYQRTLKAAGSFASFFTRFGKATHLPYLVPALQSAAALEKTWPVPQPVKALFQLEKTIGLAQALKVE